MSRYMEPASVGNSASVVGPQSATGDRAKELGLQPSVKNVVTGITRPQSSPQQINHEYSQDGDRMQCESYGFWYHI
jgi:hypothetical protein